MGKKLAAFLLCAIMAVTLVGCAKDSGSSGDKNNQNSGETQNDNTDNQQDADTGGQNQSDMEKLLIPSGAKVITKEEGALVLQSKDDTDTLIAFYKNALKQLGAKEKTAVKALGWQYTGTYGDNKPIAISITDIQQGTITITIEY